MIWPTEHSKSNLEIWYTKPNEIKTIKECHVPSMIKR